jgi:hypothetical protein
VQASVSAGTERLELLAQSIGHDQNVLAGIGLQPLGLLGGYGGAVLGRLALIGKKFIHKKRKGSKTAIL